MSANMIKMFNYELSVSPFCSPNFNRTSALLGVFGAYALIEPSSLLGYLATAVTGVSASVLTSGLLFAADRYCYTWRHRVSQSISPRDNVGKMESAFGRLKDHPLYEKYKEIENFSDDASCLSDLKKSVKNGTCFGQSVSLLRLMDQNPQTQPSNLLKLVDPENVFYFQYLENMRGAFGRDQVYANRLLSAFEILAENAIDQGPNAITIETQNKRDFMRNADAQIRRECLPWKEKQVGPVSVEEFSRRIHQILDEQVKEQGSFAGTISLQGEQKPEDRSVGLNPGHSILIQGAPGKFRFYDSNGFGDAGLYEFAHLPSFCAALQKRSELCMAALDRKMKITLNLKE